MRIEIFHSKERRMKMAAKGNKKYEIDMCNGPILKKMLVLKM